MDRNVVQGTFSVAERRTAARPETRSADFIISCLVVVLMLMLQVDRIDGLFDSRLHT